MFFQLCSIHLLLAVHLLIHRVTSEAPQLILVSSDQTPCPLGKSKNGINNKLEKQ